MRVGLLGECSGMIRDAFLARGHDAISCDLKPTEQPGPHIVGDYMRQDWREFDLLIAHPDCTYLCVSGLHWNKRRKDRKEKTTAALEHVRDLWQMMDESGAAHALENPVGCINSRIRRATQIVQPWQFGD